MWNEALLLASSLLALYAIARRIVVTVARRQRAADESLAMMLRATWKQFRVDGLRGDEMILLALLIPVTMLTVYYLLLALPLTGFEQDVDLRQRIMRSSIFTSNIILAIYFLNGRLTRAMRRLIDVWKRQSPTS